MGVRSIPAIFEEIASANSFEARQKVLKDNESNPLKDLLRYAFHPDIKFALPAGDPPYKCIGSADEYNPTYLYPNIKKFYLYVEGGHDGLTPLRREQLFVNMLEGLHPKEAKVVLQVKDKKLKFRGLTYKLVKTTFPEILP